MTIRVNPSGEASMDDNYRDTVYDALASSNRTGRAIYQAIMELKRMILFLFITGGAYLLHKSRRA